MRAMRVFASFRFQLYPLASRVWRHHIRHPHVRSTTNSASQDSKTLSRFQKLNSRLPKFLQNYTLRFKDAPISHFTSFLILHELTAVIPLFSFAALFHYFNWLPPFISELKWVSDGVQKFGNYARKKGWISSQESKVIADEGKKPNLRSRWFNMRSRLFNSSEKVTRLIVEFATAYALTKVLLPVRILLSLWAAPWFARTFILSSTRSLKKFFGVKPKLSAVSQNKPGVTSTSPAAGTGATAGHVLPSAKDRQ